MLCFEPPQSFGDRSDVCGIVRDIVAGQDEHVGFEPVRHLHRTLNVFKRGKWAVVRVGKLDDLEAVKLRRQAFE